MSLLTSQKGTFAWNAKRAKLDFFCVSCSQSKNLSGILNPLMRVCVFEWFSRFFPFSCSLWWCSWKSNAFNREHWVWVIMDTRGWSSSESFFLLALAGKITSKHQDPWCLFDSHRKKDISIFTFRRFGRRRREKKTKSENKQEKKVSYGYHFFSGWMMDVYTLPRGW